VNTADRPTFPTAPRTGTVWPAFISVARRELVASRHHQRQRRRLNQIEPLGNFRQNRSFHDTKFGVSIVRHSEHLVADRKAFHSRPNLGHSARDIHSYKPRKLEWVKIFR
jgi:hypothetical protein